MADDDERSGDGQDDHTTELDRSSLGISPMGLPFPTAPESQRASLPSIEDGALPFRGSSPPPPLAPPPPVRESSPPSVMPRPAPILAPPPPSAPSLATMVLPVVAPAPLAPAARTEFSDVFRRAFGFARGPGAPALESSPPSASSTPSPPSRPSTSSGLAALPTSARASRLDAPEPAGSSSSGLSIPSSLPSGGLQAPSYVRAASARSASDAALAPEVRAAAAESRIAPANPLNRRAIVDLLAFDPGVPSRLRRSKEHAPLLASPAASRSHQGVDAPAAESSADDRARNDVLRVLSCGSPMAAEALALAFDALLDDPLDLDLPLFLVEGDVSPTMDEFEALRAIVEHAKPLAGSNKRLLGALTAAGDALARSTLPPPEAAVALYNQVEAATVELGLPPRHVAKMVERTLRDARAHKRLTLLGAPRIRATLTLGGVVLPIYLPQAISDLLPLLPTFRVTALVESRPREDAAEASPTALVALAVGRVLRARGVTLPG